MDAYIGHMKNNFKIPDKSKKRFVFTAKSQGLNSPLINFLFESLWNVQLCSKDST